MEEYYFLNAFLVALLWIQYFPAKRIGFSGVKWINPHIERAERNVCVGKWRRGGRCLEREQGHRMTCSVQSTQKVWNVHAGKKMVKQLSSPQPSEAAAPRREVCHGNTGSIRDLGNKGSFSCSIQSGSSSLPTKTLGAVQHFSLQWHRI